jgi:hypothetical protein
MSVETFYKKFYKNILPAKRNRKRRADMLWKNRPAALSHFTTHTTLSLVAMSTLALAPLAHAETTTATAPVANIVRKPVGLKTAVVAATDTGGDADIALRALEATNIALARSSGYALMAPSTVAANLKAGNLQYPFEPREYETVRKRLGKADRVVAVTVTPGDVNDTTATYRALVEMFDTMTGGLVGRGESTYTATANSPAVVTSTTSTVVAPTQSTSTQVVGSFPAPAGTVASASATTTTTVTSTTTATAVQGDAPRFLAVDGAILNAVAQMNEPALVNGIVISLPNQHTARLSVGTMQGLRNGSRIEYLVRGTPIAYGTVIDAGRGDSLATVAPERAFPFIEVNSEWRTASIPAVGAAGLSRDQIDEREWKKFQRDFGIGAAIAGVGYLLFLNS